MRYTLTVIIAAIGSLVTTAGMLACFLFGLIPILQAISKDRTISILAGIFLLGILSWIFGLRALFRIDRETWIHDETTRTWTKVS